MKLSIDGVTDLITKSLPSWECGLKFVDTVGTVYSCIVTPFVGVWIEIPLLSAIFDNILSLPSWECGLKFLYFKIIAKWSWSLPSWECGLKSV